MPTKILHSKQQDVFRAQLENILDPPHAMVLLADRMDWSSIEDLFAPLYSDKGRLANPIRRNGGFFNFEKALRWGGMQPLGHNG